MESGLDRIEMILRICTCGGIDLTDQLILKSSLPNYQFARYINTLCGKSH